MSGKRAEVLFEYVPENEDELPLEVGTIIHNVIQAEEGWMEGTANGKSGVFPDNFVKVLPDEAPPAVVTDGGSKSSGRKIVYAKVTFAYDADNEDELTLEVGQTVEVLGEVEDGWWKGKIGSREGVFPENFVEKLSEQDNEAHRKKISEPAKPDVPPATEKPPAMRPGLSGGVKLPFMMPPGGAKTGPPPPAAPVASEPDNTTDSAKPSGGKITRATVSFDYQAEAEDELSLRKGDVIEITSQEISEGWWEGKCGGKVGVFPNNFVELLPEEPAPAPVQAPGPRKPIPKMAMVPGITPGDLNLKKTGDSAAKKAEAAKKEDAPSRPHKPGPPPPGSKQPASAPKIPGKPAPPAAKRQTPGVPGVPAKKPEPEEPKKPALRPVAGSRRSADVSSAKDDVEAEPAVKPSQPAKRHVPEPAKPASTEENIPPWKKELQQKRKNTGESGPPPPAVSKPDPVKEPPPPAASAPAPTPAPAPVVNKPAPKITPAKPPPSVAVAETKPDETKKEPAPAASGVSSAELSALREEIAKMQKKMADMETNFVSEIEKLESEIDDEKKSRVTMQVEIDRLKRKNKD
eukprot:scpid17732/ scgid3621/ CD2-associated protein; Mesenchyme-to-epithelium transition protein with SH3 domains 1